MKKSVVTIGNFDGVHLGHKVLIDLAQREASKKNTDLTVYTFNPHPVMVLAPGLMPPLLQSVEERLDSLKKLGVQRLVVETFDQSLANKNAVQFFKEVLKDKLNATTIVVGYDFTFGKNREGNTELLHKLGDENNIDVIAIPPQFKDDILISSTNIRRAIDEGEVGIALKLLGRPFHIKGPVVKGHGMGRTLGVKTANIVTQSQLIPANGIYLTKTILEEKEYQSVTSIGNNPTFTSREHSIETHLLDVEMDLTGKTLSIGFLKKLRDQQNFGSLEKLTHQITNDLKIARRLHETWKNS